MIGFTPFVIFGFIAIAIGKKWQIKSKHIVYWLVVSFVLYCITASVLSLCFPTLSKQITGFIGFIQSMILSFLVLLVCFYRDPERTPPERRDVILSPADGTIVYIKKIKKNEFPFATKKGNIIPLSELTKIDYIKTGGYQVGIAMNFLNVHVNRAPIEGKISLLKRINGRFMSLRHIRSLLENERLCTIIHNENIDVCVVQIASRLVRRIITFIGPDSYVAAGQRIGTIRFGSQVDLLIPKNDKIRITAKEKEEVKAGLSIIAEYSKLHYI